MEIAFVLPYLKPASTRLGFSEQCPRCRNRFMIVQGIEFVAPNDLPVPVEQVTPVFDDPQRLQRPTPRKDAISSLDYTEFILMPNRAP